MISVKFKGCNKVFGTDDSKDKTFIMSVGDNKVVAYKLTILEKLRLIFGGKIWFWFQAQGVPNFSLTCKKPFILKPFEQKSEDKK